MNARNWTCLGLLLVVTAALVVEAAAQTASSSTRPLASNVIVPQARSFVSREAPAPTPHWRRALAADSHRAG